MIMHTYKVIIEYVYRVYTAKSDQVKKKEKKSAQVL